MRCSVSIASLRRKMIAVKSAFPLDFTSEPSMLSQADHRPRAVGDACGRDTYRCAYDQQRMVCDVTFTDFRRCIVIAAISEEACALVVGNTYCVGRRCCHRTGRILLQSKRTYQPDERNRTLESHQGTRPPEVRNC